PHIGRGPQPRWLTRLPRRCLEPPARAVSARFAPGLSAVSARPARRERPANLDTVERVPHDWFLQLLGDPFDLTRLTEAFATASPVSITSERDQYRLRKETLTEIDDAEAVRIELEATLSQLNALARLHWGSDYDDVHSGGVGEVNAANGVNWYD